MLSIVAVCVASLLLVAFVLGGFYVVGFRHGADANKQLGEFFGRAEDDARVSIATSELILGIPLTPIDSAPAPPTISAAARLVPTAGAVA